MSETITVTYEATPNPDSMKFNVSQKIADENLNFAEAGDTQRSPLAAKIFGFPWAAGVFIGSDFVTINKQDWVDWEIIAEPLAGLIREHIELDLPILVAAKQNDENENDSPEVKEIKRVINDEVRPAVAMDGGDIVFHSYKDNRVYIHMQGACAGCPSSTMTLKMGIEARIREAVPEVEEVIAI